jgi:hypothetical protein
MSRLEIMKYISITIDTNDADYVTLMTKITDDEVAKFMPLIEAIKNFKPYTAVYESQLSQKWTHGHNWPNNEYAPREDLGEKTVEDIYKGIKPELIHEFMEYVPAGSHSIKSITLYEVSEVKELLKV